MSDDTYSVRINRQEGIVEITGPDKDWVAGQLNRLSAVYEGALDETPPPRGDEASKGETTPKTSRTRRVSGRTMPRPATGSSQVAEKLTKEVTDRFNAFWAERDEKQVKSQPDRAAVIATFLQDELGIEEIEGNDLIVVHRAMGWPPPKNPSGVITNGVSRRGYFGGFRDGKVRLTPTGEHFGRHGSKEAPAS